MDLAERVVTGERFVGRSVVDTEVGPYELVEVHPAQLDSGLLAMWRNYYGDLGRFDLPQQVIQVKAPLVCLNHPLSTWSLDRPAPLLNRPPAAKRPPQGVLRAKPRRRPRT